MFLEPKVDPSPTSARRTPHFTAWDAALVGCLALVFASAVLSLWWKATGSRASAEPLAWSQGLTFAITGGIPFLWLLRTRAAALAGALDYLRLRSLKRAFPYGVAIGVAMALAAMVLLRAAPPFPPEWTALARALPFWVVLGPLGEEILFRGILQARFGVLIQALAFTLLHVAATTPLQRLVVLGCGLALGMAAKRWGLWASTVAHATYNLIALV